jgi:hypothetical protein
LLAAVALIAVLLRVAYPTLTEFKFGEARLVALALDLTREGRLPLIGVPSSAAFEHSPWSVYLYAPAFLGATNPIPATIYGGLVGAAAVALCWWLARRWPPGSARVRSVVALLAAGLLAVSPWAVISSRKIWQVTFVPLLSLLFVGLAISALVGRRHRNLAWALAVYAILVQVHPSAIGLAPALVLWLLIFRRQVRPRPLLVGGGLGLLSAFPFLLYQAQNGWPAWHALQTLPAAVWDMAAVRLTWEAITGWSIHALAGRSHALLAVVPQIGRILKLAGWLLVVAGLRLAWLTVVHWRSSDLERREAAQVDLVLLSWLVVPVLFSLRHNLELHLHFFVLVVPAAYLIAGRATVDWMERIAARRWRLMVAVGWGFLAGAQVLAVFLTVRFAATHDTTGGFGTPLGTYLDLADQTVARAEAAGAAEVVVAGYGDSAVTDELPAIFDVLLRDRTTYRFVDGRSGALFPPHRAVALEAPEAASAMAWYEGLAQAPLSAGYRLVTLDGSRSPENLMPIAGPRLFANGVELQGYRWEPGLDRGRFWLSWQVLWLDPDDTHFFVRLLQDGAVVGQQDGAGYRNDQRRKGDQIVSLFEIDLPEAVPEATLAVEVGLYRYPQIVNVPLIDTSGNRIGETVQIDPSPRQSR